MNSTLEWNALLAPLLAGHWTLPDETWLPVLIAAVRRPEEWAAAFSGLNAKEQERMLEIFAGNGANCYTDTLLVLLAAQPGDDVDTMRMLTHLARRVVDRHRDRLARLDAAIVRHTAPVPTEFSGLLPEYAARLLDLNSTLEQRIAANTSAWPLLNLELAIARREWQLGAWSDDLKKRTAEREELDRAIAAVTAQLAAVVAETAAGRPQLEALQAQYAAVAPQATADQERLTAAQAELDALQVEWRATCERLATVRQESVRLQAELESNRCEIERLNREQDVVTATAETLTRQLDEARHALEELRQAPEIGRLEALQAQLAKTFQLLPPDDSAAKA